MPVYNAGRFLRGAVSDVLRQTCRDFELLAVDDGSTDGSRELLQAVADPRVRVLALGKNHGLVGALNAGLAEARGRWVARQDADDRCRPDRLQKQRQLLEEHPEAVLVYSRARLIGDRGWWRGSLRPPVDDAALRWDLSFRNAVPHTSAVFPAALVRDQLGGYEGDNVTADYDLWSRLLRVGPGHGVPQSLVSYRNHGTSIMGQDRQESAPSRTEALVRLRTWNLREWLGATEAEAETVAAAWTRPARVDWERYFEVTEGLVARAGDHDLRPGEEVLQEEDYTLFHLALAAGRENGKRFMEAMKQKSPSRRAALPRIRTFLARWT